MALGALDDANYTRDQEDIILGWTSSWDIICYIPRYIHREYKQSSQDS